MPDQRKACLLDTSAWIEYFKGTPEGNRVAALLRSGSPAYTCPLTITEVAVWCYRNHRDPSPFLEKIRSFSLLLDLAVSLLSEAARVYTEQRLRQPKIGIIDCIIYASALLHGLTLLTKDQDFAGLASVSLL
ncbi:MAG: PIN domain-containing protein [Candidatus Aenigmarchaeota archaeon]|nr:PIN domain-containing protein [Candidatus Aenigmarchaeota archaeon]